MRLKSLIKTKNKRVLYYVPQMHDQIPVCLNIDDLDSQHGSIKHKVARLIKDYVGQANPVHLLQLSLNGHPATKLHVWQLLPHLLQLCEHLLTHKKWDLGPL